MWPRVAIERMNTPSSRAWSPIRTRSPRIAPPEKGDDGRRSFKSGTLQSVRNPDTIADGARTPSLGKLTFPIVLRNVDDMLTVTDADSPTLASATVTLTNRPSGAMEVLAADPGTITASDPGFERVPFGLVVGDVESSGTQKERFDTALHRLSLLFGRFSKSIQLRLHLFEAPLDVDNV